jgi:AhpD family alkylhydroperoxidase
LVAKKLELKLELSTADLKTSTQFHLVWQLSMRTARMAPHWQHNFERRGKASSMDEFDRYRADMNEKLLGSNHLGIKRFFALDTQAYEDGALDKRTKELLGLVASIVLRCDDCITYHVKQSVDAGVTRPEFLDAFNVALVVGGSITIPHLRRAIDRLDQTLAGETGEPTRHQHD